MVGKMLDQHRYTIGKPLLKNVGSSLGRHNWISVWTTTDALYVILASVGPMQILQAHHWLNVGFKYIGQQNIKVLLAFQIQSIVGPTVGDYVWSISKMTLIQGHIPTLPQLSVQQQLKQRWPFIGMLTWHQYAFLTNNYMFCFTKLTLR